MNILIINGPNLNQLGQREPHIYGTTTMSQVLQKIQQKFPHLHTDYKQSNIEGELLNFIYQAQQEGVDAIILNAGAYSHTSIALYDCIKAVQIPVVEVHITNITQREPFRHTSLITPACIGAIQGFGTDSYLLAIQALALTTDSLQQA